jgi:uncharacterized membrane-anchored protein YjiN (DUF445 family)
MNTPQPNRCAVEDPRRTALRQMQWTATGLLLAALVGLSLGHAMGAGGAWAWVVAGCEAAAVGALADWFAVVALFRRPLGLKLPHTAIIPSNKARIADNLAQFVRDHFLAPEVLLPKLQAFNPAERLSQWLCDPQRVQAWVGRAQQWAGSALDLVDDVRVQRALVQMLREQAQGWNASATAGEVFHLLTQNGRHHELLNAGLEKVAQLLASEPVKQAVAGMVVKHVRKEWPTAMVLLEKMVPATKMADSLAEKVSASAIAELREVLSQPEHPLRQRYEQWVAEQIERLRADPELMADINQLKDRVLADPAVVGYVGSLWGDVKRLLRADLADPSSKVGQHLAGGLAVLGERLAQDPSLRQALNEHVMSVARQFSAGLQTSVAEHIASTLKAWDDRQLVDEIERSVGRDLQFIRINGTLIGALAGLVLYGLSRALA